VIITSRELTGIPNTPIAIVTPPQYGTAEVRNEVSIIYTSNLTDPTSTVVDVVVYQYTNLSGAVVVARKEFLLKQEGDVPRIIQTGETDNSWWLTLFAFISALIVALSIFARRNYLRNGAR
jgi:LPXTG-motif cell wall-anchored protein